jgi:D-alanyl-lipoteichoic acid acyltransferase DltB (MBOAT superfamily)
LNSRNTWKKWFLVAASYYFYAFWRVEFTLLLAASSVGNYLVALWLGALPDGRARRLVLCLAIAANLSALGFFKYWDFFAAQLINLAAMFGVVGNVPFVEMALPVAISFLTFHALSYIIDVYDRRLKPTTSPGDILLYISFFPHLIAGPIVRAAKFLAQTTHRAYQADVKLAQSVFLILGGLFKKVIIANYLSTDFVDGVFRAPADYSSLDLLLGMYAYAIQIYCDFSAYTDIAIGIARLLGYEFPQNFNQPYRALSVQDFWRRWHMTLSSWLRDYLYIRLGGNRGGRLATYRNIIITMGLGGLWHGASWNFVLWGLLHGAALVVKRILGLTGAPRSRIVDALLWLVTLHFVCFTWIFFRSPSSDARTTRAALRRGAAR